MTFGLAHHAPLIIIIIIIIIIMIMIMIMIMIIIMIIIWLWENSPSKLKVAFFPEKITMRPICEVIGLSNSSSLQGYDFKGQYFRLT